MIIKQCISIIVCISLLSNQMLFAGSLDLDKSATQKTSLDTAANGVPIVNITTPNAQGLSHNKFTNYNVDPKGLILNNANNVVQTQLGGFIASNPNLSGSSAKTILNEVTGTNRSLLNGYTEVAGDQADVIIANPNGISINGGGFINTPKVTLSTGTPTLLNGQVSGFNVAGGDIVIEGDGFNANSITQVDLYSKVLTLNAKLYAQNLNIVTGENQIASDGTITSKQAVGTGVSLDSSALGGIYAQKITLVGTDKGVGVNLPPEVLASNGPINISSDGKITFQKTTASQAINAVSTSNDIVINGAVSTSANIALQAKTSIINNNVITAGLQADGSTNTASTLTLQATDIFNQNQINSSGILTLNALTSITNTGTLYAPTITPIHTRTLNNTGTLLSQSALMVNIDDTLINDGVIHSDDTLSISTTTLANHAKINTNSMLLMDVYSLENTGYMNANTLTITTHDLSNSGTLFSAQDLSLSATSTLSNSGTINSGNNLTLISNGTLTNTNVIVAGLRTDNTVNASALMSITADSILNKGSIISYGDLALNANILDTQNYLYSANYLVATINHLNNTGTFNSNDSLKLLVAKDALNSGIINAGKSLTIDVDESLTNTASISAGFLTDGTYNADASLSIKANTLINQSKINSQGTLTLNTSALSSSVDGYLNANNDLQINADSFSNAGTVFSNKHLTLTLKSDFTNTGSINGAQSVDLTLNGGFTNNGIFMSGINHDGTYSTDASINIQASSLTNSGKISSQKDLYLITPTFNNYNYLYATNILQLVSNNFTNTGTLFSNNDLTLASKNAISNDGLINGANQVTLTTSGALTNNGTLSAGLYKDGTFNTNANLSIQALSLINNQLNSQGDLSIKASTFENKNYARASHTFLIEADTLTNSGLLYSNAYLTLTLHDTLTNNGTIDGGTALDIVANTKILNYNTLLAGLYDNGTVNANATLKLQSPTILNSAKVNSSGTADIQTSSLTNSGYFNTNNDLTITTNVFANAGTLFSDQDLTLFINSVFNNEGTINGGNQLDLHTNGALINNGTLSAGLYHNGTTNANATLSILHSSAITNNAKINSYGSTSLTTAAFNNYNYLYTTNLLQLNANTLTNTGTLLSDSILTLSINSDFTNEGTINSAKTLDMSINGTLINNGTLSAGLYKDGTSNTNAALDIQASMFTNNAKVRAYGDMRITVPNTLTNQGYFSAANTLTITANTLKNYSVLFSGADMNLWVSDLLYNYENANILALGNLVMAKDASLAKTQHIVNDKATIETIEGDISLYAVNFENKTDGLVKGTRLIGTETLQLDPSGSGIEVAYIVQARDRLIAQGKYQTLIGATATSQTNCDDDGRNCVTAVSYNGIPDTKAIASQPYVKQWDTVEYDDDNNPFTVHHSQQVYDIKYVTNEDIVSELNTILLPKFGMPVRYGYGSLGAALSIAFNIPPGFYYTIQDLQGGEDQRIVTITSQQEYMISQTTPAKLLSGRKLSINADTITNYLSEISSNDDMTLTGTTLNNQSEVLYQTLTRTGQYEYQSRSGGFFHDAKYSWAPLPSVTTYTQADAAYSLIYSAKNITGNLATVNNIDIKSNQAPLGHSATTNVTPTITLDATNVNVSTPQADTTIAPTSAIAVDSLNVNVSTSQPTTTVTSPTKPIIDPKTHDISITLPKGDKGLFVVSTDPKSHYLIETNPAFASFSKFIGSDYMLSRLGYNPDATTKRLGDAFYENQFVRDSIFAQTGKRYLSASITNDSDQFKYLMDNALSVQDDLKLTPYVRLSASQVSALTKDIVWMEDRVIDGQHVLVPVVYIANAALARTTDNGAKIVANGNINLGVDTLTNQGDIKAGGDMAISASQNIYNEGGAIGSGGNMALQAGGGIYNISGDLSAKALSITAATFQSDIASVDLTHNYSNIGTQNSQLLSEISTINVKNDVTIKTTKDLSLIGTTLNAGGNLNLASSEGNIIISSKTHEDTYDIKTRKGYNKGDSTHEIGSSISANSISMSSDTLLVNASDVTAQNDMNIKANTIAITAGEDRVYTDSKYELKGGFMGGSKKTADTADKKTVVASTLSAKNLNIDTKSLSIQGSKLTAQQANIASEVIELISLKNSDYESHFSDSSGMMTRTIISKGHVKEEVIPALIQVRNQLIVNNKDVTNQLKTDNLVKTITSQSGLSVEQIKLVEAYAQSEEWNKHMTSLTGVGSLVIAAIVTVCTMGAGAGFAAAAVQGMNLSVEAATQAAIQSAIEASIHAMVVQATTSLVTAAITGNSPVLDASSLIKGAVLAGVMQYTSGYTKVGDLGQGEVVNKVAQGTVNAGVKTAITGGSLKDNLINEAAQATYTAVGDYSMSQDQGTGGNSNWSEGGVGKVILHSAVGAGVAAAKGEDVLAGAASGAVAELARPLTEGQDKTIQSTVSSVIGGLTAGAVGGEGSINVGSYIGQTSDQYNRQLHEQEIQFIEKNAQSFADAQGLSLEDAKARLAQQGLRQTDKAWSYALGTETDAAAQAFLTQNAPTLFTVKDAYEFKDGTTNGQQEIGSLSQEAYNQLKNFYTSNVYVTTSTNSDGSMRPINEAFAKETNMALSSINGETANQAIRDFFPNMINAARNAPDMVSGAGNYVQNIFPTTTQERMNELYNQGNDGSKVQANLATMDFINTATMALPLGATVVKGVEKGIAATVAKETVQSAEKAIDVSWKTAAQLSAKEADNLLNEALPTGVKVENIGSANALNEAVLAKDVTYKAPYLADTKVIDFTTTTESQWVRVYATETNSDIIGNWVIRAEDVKGLSPEQIAQKFSLPQVPNMMADVTVPAGQKMQASVSNAIFEGAENGGGGVQFQIKVPEGVELDKNWFTNPTPLK